MTAQQNLITVVIGLMLAIFGSTATADVLRVLPPGSGMEDGSDWDHAIGDLESAIGIATVGDQIWLGQGIHKPCDSGNTSATFTLPSGVELFGGFVGDEDFVDEAEVVSNPV
jgi:hypothetical protein